MTSYAAGHLAMLGVAAALLGGAAVRLASVVAPAGLERVVSAAAVGVALAVVEALALGLVGAGSSPAALLGAALLTWAALRALAPAPAASLGAEARRAWAGLETWERVALGAVAGALVAFTAWMLRHPSFGIDGILYHSTEVVAWVDSGEPGSSVTINEPLPFGSYPLTNEVALTWACGIARSFVPVAPWMAGMLALLAASSWLGARTVGASRPVAALAAASLALLPVTVFQLNGPNTDLPALAWLVTCAALALAATRPGATGAGRPARGARPELLAPALVAAGLAVGTKTTAAPLALLALAVAAWPLRGRLRGAARPLAGAAVLAVAVGALWYLRNLVEHGSPLWPFVRLPGGDPLPELFERYGNSLLDAPRATVDAHWPAYRDDLAGGLVLLAGALVAPLLSRSRAVLGAAGATALGLLLWTRAPFTGLPGVDVLAGAAASTDRYLMPTLAAATLTLVLASRGSPEADARSGESAARERPRSRLAARRGRGPRWGPPAARGLLGAAVLWDLVRLADVGFPVRPSTATLLAGAAAGAVAAWALRPFLLRAVPAPARLPALTFLAALALAPAADGWLARHARTQQFDASVASFFAAQPGWEDTDEPVAMEPATAGPLAGDRLSHRVELIRSHESCARIARRRREGWVVLFDIARASPVALETPAARCLAGQRPVYAAPALRVFAPLHTATRSSAESRSASRR